MFLGLGVLALVLMSPRSGPNVRVLVLMSALTLVLAGTEVMSALTLVLAGY